MTARPRLRRTYQAVLATVCLFAASLGAARTPTLDDAAALYVDGQLSAAIDAYRAVAAAHEETDPATAGTARNNACVILMNTGSLNDAVAECDAAVRARRIDGDPLQLARSCNNLGLALHYTGRYEDAEAMFVEALHLNESLADVGGQTINWANLGVLATEAGWYSKALTRQRRAFELAAAHAEAPWAAEQMRLARINQAVVLERLGAYREALGVYDEVLDDEEMPARQRAALMVNRGVVYRNLGDPVRAVHAYEAAIETYQALADRASLSNAYLNLALVHQMNLADDTSAERAYRRALELARESGERNEEIRGLYYLGRLMLKLDRVDEAQTLFGECLAESEESGSSEGRWAAREGLGRVEKSRGRLEASLEQAMASIDEIERVRGSLADSTHRSDYFGDKRGVYQLAVDTLAELDVRNPGHGHARRAFEIVHRAKARGLLDALGPQLQRSAPPDADTIVDVVGGDLLIEFFLGDSKLHRWAVHDGSISMQSLDEPAELLRRVDEVHRALSHGSEPPIDAVRDLSRQLLFDLEPAVSRVNQVRIAPDGALFYLPFELLELPGRDGPLIEHATLSYLPNGAALDWLHRDRAPPPVTLIGLGDPPLASADPERGASVDVLVRRFNLGRLSAAGGELDRIGRLLTGPSIVRTGVDATEEALGQLVQQGARVAHIVSHTIVDERPGRGAAILLAPGENSDGLLYPHEIAAMHFPVDLTVLAACRTAVSGSQQGPALATLTGAFLAAGSSAVVATLWDVGDEATAVFMEQFYFQLQRGQTPATALRNAKRRMIEHPQWNDSSVWAAYVLVGDADPIAASPISWGWWLVALGALLAGVFLLRQRYGVTRN